ncbi:hypothetical protein [Streptomyces anulatus]|uniref:hypothetical protein n=1 Tax=Streptomyces anulatus TaxID=1892 RepID=UPI0022565588|nr:hypothetical protein [Streptomyces anulatus]MCX4506716.1 hypothetical protein [Streptomyces anulatus]
MTNTQILAACRSNWEYRGIDDASVREMLDELSAHLEDAQTAGRSGQDVVGRDVRSFAAAWARARAPLPHRALRTVSLTCFGIGCVLLLACLLRSTTKFAVTPDYLAFWISLCVATVGCELRRGRLGMRAGWVVAIATALPIAILTRVLAGGGVLFTLPLWAASALLLPGLPYAAADARARRSGHAADVSSPREG